MLASLGDALIDGKAGAANPPKGLYGLYKATRIPTSPAASASCSPSRSPSGRRVGQ